MLPSIAFTAVCVAALVVAERRGARAGIWLAKPLASAGFVAAALAAGALGSLYGTLVLAGLALSLVGDVLLVPRGAPRAFLCGMGAFGAAHVAYAAAFVARETDPVLALCAAAAMALFAVSVLRWLRPHLAREWRLPVAAYTAVISLMVALAIGAATAPGGALGAAGATLFAASDLSVARDRFVSPGFANAAWGLPVYYAAQLVLAGSIR